MKKKISIKLTLCFLAVSFILSVLTSATFLLLLQDMTSDIYKQEMMQRAKNIVKGVSLMLQRPEKSDGIDFPVPAEPVTPSDGGGATKNQPFGPSAAPSAPDGKLNTRTVVLVPRTNSGKDASVQNDKRTKWQPPTGLIYMTSDNFWVVNSEGAVFFSGRAESGHFAGGSVPQNTDELSAAQQSVITQTLKGENTFTDKFSSIFGDTTLTVGVPVKTKDGGIIGAVFYHNEQKAMEQVFTKSLPLMLLCMLAGLGITAAVSYVVSLTITKPVKKMKETALQLAAGEYTAKSGIRGEDEISELGETMDILADRLDEAHKESLQLEQLRRDFVSNVSHELRTPLTVIRGCTESLLDGIYEKEEDILRQYEKILAEGRTLERLVRDLLELSKLQNMSFQIANETVNLDAVLKDAVTSMSVVARDKNVPIELDAADTGVIFKGDYDRMKQMLVIVLDNAVKFTQPGGSVAVRKRMLEDGRRAVEIRDSGEGIPEESLPHIFDRFYKSDVSHNSSGTGLGLPIAKEIANRMQIQIQVESRFGEGTTFRFILPDEKNT